MQRSVILLQMCKDWFVAANVAGTDTAMNIMNSFLLNMAHANSSDVAPFPQRQLTEEQFKVLNDQVDSRGPLPSVGTERIRTLIVPDTRLDHSLYHDGRRYPEVERRDDLITERLRQQIAALPIYTDEQVQSLLTRVESNDDV